MKMVISKLCDRLDQYQLGKDKLEQFRKDPKDLNLATEAIKKWATPDKLRRLRYIREEDTGKRIIPSEAFHDMPMLSREHLLHSSHQEKFNISDGIHRINRARELGIDCILASVEEHVDIDKTDTNNVEVK